MDSIFHATRKIMIERAAMTAAQQEQEQRQQKEVPDVAPPAYSAEPPTCCDAADDCFNNTDTNDDDDDDDDEVEADPCPVTLTLNARTQIQGTGNIIASSALGEATRFSALLLAAVQSLNAKAEAEKAHSAMAAEGGGSSSSSRARPTLNVRLVIDCGVTVYGDRNVVGCRPFAGAPRQAAAGVKRKADEAADGANPSKKRVCVQSACEED